MEAQGGDRDGGLLPLPRRPGGVAALGVFFGAGAAISLAAAAALLDPGGLPEPMWQWNPRAREGFAGMGHWAPVLLGAVSIACGSAGLGLWRGWRWGHRLAVALIVVNLAGDVINTVAGTERRAIVGVPVALLMLLYLRSARVRRFFGASRDAQPEASGSRPHC
jgi:hypothetical protein